MIDVSIILTVAKEIAGGLGKFFIYEKDRREAAAAYFEQIADTIAAFSPKLRSGASDEELVELSAKMKTFAEELPKTVGRVIGKEKAKSLSQELKAAYNVKMLLTRKKKNVKQPEEKLIILAEAAGHLRASAISLRAAK